MSFTDVCRSFASGFGRFIGTSFNVLTWPQKVLRKTVEKQRPPSPGTEVRSIVIEELARLQGEKERITLPELEKRLQFMAETIETLQKKIAELTELSARGLTSETLVTAAIASVEGAEFLSDEEKAILASIFRQNITIQKPYLIDTAVG